MNNQYSDEEIREAARKSLKKKQEFWRFVLIAVVVSALVTGVYYFTGSPNYFWPVWVYIGMTMGIIFSAIDTFGPNSKFISEDKLQKEIRRLRGE